MKKTPLKIGILNIMHDKADTQRRYHKIFEQMPFDVDATFFYPRTHYLKRPVPDEVARISQPLDLKQVKNFDAFIITGAPIEHFAFDEVEYMEEIRCLLDELNKNHVEQLYFCWGAMAAMNHFYGIKKEMLPKKLFGVYPHEITGKNELLANLADDFLAPHARYAEMNHEEIVNDPRLQVDAVTDHGALFLVSAVDHPEQTFLFSHMEYDRDALLKEYQREVAAHPEDDYQKPENYFLNSKTMSDPIFSWEKTQKIFFYNWLKKVSEANFKEAAIAG